MRVEYVSDWEDGLVVSHAEVDTITGEVGSIETADYGDDYEFLNREYIVVNGYEIEVSRNEDDLYCVDVKELKKRM